MLNVEKINPYVLADICENLSLDVTNKDDLEKVASLSVSEAFNSFLIWNGIVGYTDMITRALDNIRASSK